MPRERMSDARDLGELLPTHAPRSRASLIRSRGIQRYSA